MTQAQIALVQNSFAVVAPIADDAAALFYRRLFEIDPTLKAMFKGDMAEQRRKLMQMLSAAVKGLNHIERLIPVVEDLGRRHVDYGVEEHHYDTVGNALLWTLEKGFGCRIHARGQRGVGHCLRSARLDHGARGRKIGGGLKDSGDVDQIDTPVCPFDGQATLVFERQSRDRHPVPSDHCDSRARRGIEDDDGAVDQADGHQSSIAAFGGVQPGHRVNGIRVDSSGRWRTAFETRPKIGGHVGRGLIPVRTVGRHRPCGNHLDRSSDLRDEKPQAGDAAVENPLRRFEQRQIADVERQPAGHQSIEHHAKRIHVAALIDASVAPRSCSGLMNASVPSS